MAHRPPARNTRVHRRALLGAALLLLAFASLSGALGALAAPAAPVAQTQIFLPLVTKAGTPSPDPDPDPAPDGPTSDELIAAAVNAGALDAETGLLYRVYAAFGDRRLPQAYRGTRPATSSNAFDVAASQFARLKPETQAALESLAVPPSAEGSWEEQQGVATRAAAATDPNRWETTCQTSPNIKVWYHPYHEGAAQKARAICELVDGTIWPQLVGFIGHGPLPDDALPKTGGDGRFDIYLVDAMSNVVYPPSKCELTPSYMLVNYNAHSRSQLAELLMRAILRGHDVADCEEYKWLFWATTNWAMDFVFPSDNVEHLHAPGYLDTAAQPLNRTIGGVDGNVIQIDFDEGAYLWPFYIARVLGDADIVGALWDRSREPDSLAMTNDVIPGGFKQQWPAFMRANWNREPQREYQVDALPHGLTPLLDEPATLDGAAAKSTTLDGAVKYLSAHSFRFTFPDASVRSVALANRYGEADLKTAHIDALLKIGGQWRVEDWTQSQTQIHGLCRDLRAERVEELVLIISNHEFADRSHALRGEDSPLLNFTNLACRGWQAEVTTDVTVGGTSKVVSETVRAEAIFERHRDEFGAWFAEDYRVKEGTATWQHTGTHGSCAGAGGGSYQLGGGPPASITSLRLSQYALDFVNGRWEFSSARRYRALGGATAAVEQFVTYGCPSGQGFKEVLHHHSWLLSDYEGLGHDASSDGARLEGSFTNSVAQPNGSVMTRTWRWKMTALPPE